MENDAKMHPKWEPKSIKNRKSDGKRHAKKQRRNLRPNKTVFSSILLVFDSIFGGEGGGGLAKNS